MTKEGRLLFCHPPIRNGEHVIIHTYRRGRGVLCGDQKGRPMADLIDGGWQFAGADGVLATTEKILRGELVFAFCLCENCEIIARTHLMMEMEGL